MALIEVRDLSVSYAQVKALKNIRLSINEGEWVLLTGPSGCGKSTLVRVLSGLIPHSIPAQVSGHLKVAKIDPRQQSVTETSQHVGIVFQNPSSQLFHLKVYDEIAFGLRNLEFDEFETYRRVNWALEATGIKDLAECEPARLSGGQKQLVAITAVLAMRPKLLVLDEPTASLDDRSIQRVINTLIGLQEKLNITIVMVEHRLTAAMKHADRLIVIDQGKIVLDNTPQQVSQNREMVNRFGLRRFTEDKADDWKTLIQKNGNQADDQIPLLELKNICAGYERKDVIKDINLKLFPGDFTALVGPNGAGKSTVALLAAGLIKPTRGKVIFESRNRPRPGLDISLLFQNPIDQLFTDSVDEEVAFGPHNYGCFDPGRHAITLKQTDLIDIKGRNPLALSIGQQHRAALGSCLALRPKLVILDEPTLGQDWGHLQQLMNFLQKLSESGAAILLISHDYKLVFRYARKVILIESGRIRMKGSLKQKNSERPLKEHAYEVLYS